MDKNEAFWFAVHTRSRHEKQVDLFLKEKNINSFLPLVNTLSRRKDRKSFVDIPLFPGYLFVHIPLDHVYEVVHTRGVVNIVGRDIQKPTPIPEKQVQSIKVLVESKVKLDPYKFLQNGTRIRVISGPLMGIEGILLKRKTNYRVVVSIDLLQQASSAEISITDIEPIS